MLREMGEVVDECDLSWGCTSTGTCSEVGHHVPGRKMLERWTVESLILENFGYHGSSQSRRDENSLVTRAFQTKKEGNREK